MENYLVFIENKSSVISGHGYDFETASLITELSLKALTPDGKLLARVSILYLF